MIEYHDAKRQAHAFKDALSAFRRVVLQAGEYGFSKCGDVTLSALPLDGPEASRPHLITLARGLLPPPEVREVPCGIIGKNGMMWAGVTDDRGQVLVELGPGTYSVRFVLEIAERVDAEIVSQTGRDSLLPLLDDVLEDPDAPAQLKKDIEGLLTADDRAALADFPPKGPQLSSKKQASGLEYAATVSQLRRMDWHRMGGYEMRLGPSRTVAMNTLSARSDGTSQTGAAEVVQERGGRLRLTLPSEHVPFGVVSLWAAYGDRLLTRRLIPMAEVTMSGKRRRVNSVSSKEWGADKEGVLQLWILPAVDKPEVLPCFAIEQVEALLAQDYVRDHPELQERINLLRNILHR